MPPSGAARDAAEGRSEGNVREDIQDRSEGHEEDSSHA
jgi:hypothetical protein